MKLNNKGFTLIEILAVIVILSVLSGIAVMGVMSTINNSKTKSYEIMIGNIASAADALYKEVENSYLIGTALDEYDSNGKSSNKIEIKDGVINTKLQTLVSNGFLTGVNNNCSDNDGDNSCTNKNGKVLLNPKDSSDLGNCIIVITKCGVTAISNDDYCPSINDFSKYFKGEIDYNAVNGVKVTCDS